MLYPQALYVHSAWCWLMSIHTLHLVYLLTALLLLVPIRIFLKKLLSHESPGISRIFSSSPVLQPPRVPEGTHVLDGREYLLEYSHAKKSIPC